MAKGAVDHHLCYPAYSQPALRSRVEPYRFRLAPSSEKLYWTSTEPAVQALRLLRGRFRWSTSGQLVPLPAAPPEGAGRNVRVGPPQFPRSSRSEEHTSELQ